NEFDPNEPSTWIDCVGYHNGAIDCGGVDEQGEMFTTALTEIQKTFNQSFTTMEHICPESDVAVNIDIRWINIYNVDGTILWSKMSQEYLKTCFNEIPYYGLKPCDCVDINPSYIDVDRNVRFGANM